MNGGYYDSYSDDLGGAARQEESGSGLRRQLEEALGEIKSLRGEIQNLQGASRQQGVSSLLESKGIDPAVAQIIPEGADASDWLDQFGHLFGSTLDEPGALPTPEEDDPDLLAEQETWEAMNGLRSSGTTETVADPIAKLESFQTQEDLLAFLAQQVGDRD